MGNCTKPVATINSPEQPLGWQTPQLGSKDSYTSKRSHVSIKTITWQRDSHELFDYESQLVKRKSIDLNYSAGISRDSADELSTIAERDYFQCNKTLLLHGPRLGSSPRRRQHQQKELNTVTALNFFCRQETNAIEESVDSPVLRNLGLTPSASKLLRTVKDNQLIEPLVHIHQYRGFFSIFDKPHVIDPVTLRPIIIDKKAETELVPPSPIRGTTKESPLSRQQGSQQCERLLQGQMSNVVGTRENIASSDQIEAPRPRRLVDRLNDYSPPMRPHHASLDREAIYTEHEEDLNRLWLIVRYLQSGQRENRFELRGGEKIKIGRIIFTVKEIVNEKIQYRSDIGESPSRLSGDMVDQEDLNLTDDGLGISEEANLDANQLESQFLLNQGTQVTQRGRTQDHVRNQSVLEGPTMMNVCLNRSAPLINDDMASQSDSVDEMMFNELDHQAERRDARQSPLLIFEETKQGEVLLPSQGRTPQLVDQNNLQEKREPESLLMTTDQAEMKKTMMIEIKEEEQLSSSNDAKSRNGCRFCWQESQSEENPFISPCHCTGSQHVVHLLCLKGWLARSDVVRVTSDEQVITYSWKAFHCEVCKAKYPDCIANPLKKAESVKLFEVSKPENNYIILESFLQDGNVHPEGQIPQSSWQKNLHVINFDNPLRNPAFKNQIKIGRGTDNDLRVQDISVSRIHAFIKRDLLDGSFYLCDNQSKFGTLVQMQHPMHLAEDMTYWFQHSRSIFRVQIEPETKLWNRVTGNREQEEEQRQRYAKFDPNGEVTGHLTGDEFYDRMGKFCDRKAAEKCKRLQKVNFTGF